jgi:hypothetical protein
MLSFLKFFLDAELFRKLFPIPVCSSVFPTVSWNCFKVSGFILKFLIHFELILVQCERQGSCLSLLPVESSFLSSIFEEAVFSPSNVLGSFVKYQLAIDAWVYV